ncbi:MAG TPA: retropepsin-like aspartic protease [Thermodesulfobacteriota bacterium]|nr:retropepsin-like aspartic protease [Thermodesulfobacteriota bacterium]
MRLRLTWIFLAILAVLLTISAFDARAEEKPPSGRATVLTDTLDVYSGMSAESEVVKRLNKGDVVTVEFEMEGSEWNWCAVSAGDVAGYVQCESLERETRKVYQRVGSSGETSYESTTSVRIVGNQVLVPVRLSRGFNEVEATLVLDTGAGATVISTEVAERLNLDLKSAIKVEAMVVGGGMVEAKVVQLDFLEVGPHRVDGLVVGVIEHKGPAVPFDGLLGMDILGGLRFDVDMEKKVIRWE